MNDKLDGYLKQMLAVHDRKDYLLLSQSEIAGLAKAVIAYRDYVHKDKDTEDIDDELAKALGVQR